VVVLGVFALVVLGLVTFLVVIFLVVDILGFFVVPLTALTSNSSATSSCSR
jgi:hypothetical protein